MRMNNFLSGLALVILASVSIGASAQTGGTPVSCIWTTTGASYPGGGVSVKLCHDGSATGPVAVAEVTNYPGGQCTVNGSDSNYYFVGTTCGTEQVFKKAPVIIPPPTCPKAGAVYPSLVRVGQGYTFPTNDVQAFCGSATVCGYTTTTVNTYPTGADLRVTCITK